MSETIFPVRTVIQDTAGDVADVSATGAVRVDGSAVTQPVSGTVTANAGTGSFTVAQATAGNLNATVTGTVTANAGTGSFTVAQATAANLNVTAALAAGTNMIGKVDLSDGTNDAVIDVTGADAESANTASLVTNARLKLYNGTTWDRVRGDITNGIDVDVTRLTPGTGSTNLGKAEDSPHVDGDTGVLILGVRNHNSGSTTDGDYSAISVDSTGNMNTLSRRDMQRISVAVPGTSTTPYAAGDQVGTMCTLANAARVSGGSGTIVSIVLQGYNDSMGSFDVVFFDSSATLAADNAAFNLATDADVLKVVAVVPLAGAYDLGANRVAQAFNIAVPYLCSGSTSLFATLITRSVFTNAAGETLQLVVYVERN